MRDLPQRRLPLLSPPAAVSAPWRALQSTALKKQARAEVAPIYSAVCCKISGHCSWKEHVSQRTKVRVRKCPFSVFCIDLHQLHHTRELLNSPNIEQLATILRVCEQSQQHICILHVCHVSRPMPGRKRGCP